MAPVNDLELALSQASIFWEARWLGVPPACGEPDDRRGGAPGRVAATTLRYYEQIGLVSAPARLGGQRRYDDSVLTRLEVIRLCKSAGFALEEIQLLFADEAPGRPASRALAEAKLAEIDAQMESLARARAVIEWGMRCTCP